MDVVKEYKYTALDDKNPSYKYMQTIGHFIHVHVLVATIYMYTAKHVAVLCVTE